MLDDIKCHLNVIIPITNKVLMYLALQIMNIIVKIQSNHMHALF